MTKISLTEKSRWTVIPNPTTPECAYCIHFNKEIGEDRMVKCKAFPNGIPRKVFRGEHDHFKKHYPGDNGILGEKKAEK